MKITTKKIKTGRAVYAGGDLVGFVRKSSGVWEFSSLVVGVPALWRKRLKGVIATLELRLEKLAVTTGDNR